MENEKTGGVRAAEHRPLCLCILAIGALFAWWNLYHDDGFLFLSNYLNQVESCLACYGGALGAFALIVGARASWRRRERPWLIALAIAQALTGTWLFIAVMADWPAGVIGGQLFIGTAFFSQLFFLMRWLCTRPVPHIAVAIAVAIATYGVLEAAAWVMMALFPLMPLRIAVRFLLLALCIVCSWRVLWKRPVSAQNGPEASPFASAETDKSAPRRLPPQLLLHCAAYWLIFGMTHAMASGIIPLGHDKLLPCYIGSVVAGGIFCVAFARDDHAAKLWPRVRTTIFPLTMLSFLLLSLANSGLTFISIGFAQCAMDAYLAFYLLATIVVMRKVHCSYLHAAATATLIAVPFIVIGVIIGDVLKVSVPLNTESYGTLSILAFLLLVAGTFWVGDDRRVELVWGLEKKLTPKRFEDKATTERCAKAVEKFGLTKREGEILLFVAQGQNAAAIAESEVISLNTARTHISRIHRKMNVHNQQELLRRLKEP